MADGYVLTTASTVTCTHPTPGKVTLNSLAKLRVNSRPVLVAGSVTGSSVSCTIPDNPNTSTKRCAQVAKETGGHAPKLKVGNIPALLDGLTGMTDGQPPVPPAGTPLTASADQSKLKAG
jgi:hypothetical protein